MIISTSDSDDKKYRLLLDNSLSFIIIDNDTASIHYDSDSINIIEDASEQLYFYLNSKPTHDVKLLFSTDNDELLSITPTALTFTSDNYSTDQFITIKAIDNSVFGDSTTVDIIVKSESEDDDYYESVRRRKSTKDRHTR